MIYGKYPSLSILAKRENNVVTVADFYSLVLPCRTGLEKYNRPAYFYRNTALIKESQRNHRHRREHVKRDNEIIHKKSHVAPQLT